MIVRVVGVVLIGLSVLVVLAIAYVGGPPVH